MRAIFNALPFPTEDKLCWLLNQGVDADAMALPWPIRSALVHWLPCHTFYFTKGGDPAVIFRAEDRGEAIDLCAWSPRTNKLASWSGAAFCIGDADQIYNPATWFANGGLKIHKTPLEWLRAGRQGIVIVRSRPTYAHLRHVPRLIFDDVEHAEQVQRWCKPPKSKNEFLVRTSAHAERKVA